MANDLENNLIVGGLTPSAAKVISNAIANLSTGRTYAGRQLADATPSDRMRLIDGDTRRYLFPNLDYPLDSPFRTRINSTAAQYSPASKAHPYQDSQPASSNPTLATPSIKGGKFVEVAAKTVSDVSQSEVALRIAPRGGTHARLNSATGEVEAVPITVVGEPEGRIEATVQELSNATLITLRLIEAPAAGGTGAAAWDDITGKPSQFAPAPHLHTIADTTGLQAALDSKQGSGSYAPASHTHTSSQISDFTAAVLAALPADFDGGVVT